MELEYPLKVKDTSPTLRDEIEGIPPSNNMKVFFHYPNGNRVEIGDVKNKASTIINSVKPELTAISLASGLTVGAKNEYLSSILSPEEAVNLEWGKSFLIISPTGTGKTNGLETISETAAKEIQVIYLTNRIACKIQIQKDLLSHRGFKNIPSELIDQIDLGDNLKVMTYQSFAKQHFKFERKQILLILDECHCLVEDSTFSTYPEQTLAFIRRNLDYTKRIYVTATPDDVLETICRIEALTNNKLTPITMDTKFQHLINIAERASTRIQHIYQMQENWDYLSFKVYNLAEKEKLIEYIKNAGENGRKSVLFINDIEQGKSLQEELPDCQHIYSDEDKRSELSQIAMNERFDSNTLITTKVAENGLSLHDEKLSIIVAESWDLVTLQQVIGRVRINRRNPRNIEVLIPDYSLSDLGVIKGKIYHQLVEARKAVKNPELHMEYFNGKTPYTYYSTMAHKVMINEIGLHTIEKQAAFIQQLMEEEMQNKHAFVRRVLALYHKEPEVPDTMLLDYSAVAECKDRIQTAWAIYKASIKDENALKQLKEALKSACNETRAYGKELKSNIQIDTVNDILSFADIKERVMPERRVFDIVESEA
ncbi:MAG: DEAD/DEAH box helicase family protein [Ruminococcus sp.]|nr:DEAD/DEAH box helicase family protein [Ruminococcus sp.]